MIFVSVYPNTVAIQPGNAEYTMAFADDTSPEAIATELFNHGESDKAVGITDPGEIHENLLTTVKIALKPPTGFAVSINMLRRLVADVR